MKSLAYFFLLQSSDGVRPRNLARSLRKQEMRIEGLSPRVLSSCMISTQAHYNKFTDYQFVEPQTGKKIYLGTMIHPAQNNPQSSKNTLAYPAADDEIVTRSNGYCDKGVYRSWNKCNVNGECFEECEDGLCHDQHKNGGTKILVPNGCLTWYIKCAEDCSNDPDCAAFSFLDTNILGHAEYTCNLMTSLNCVHGNLNQGDPRSSFHVKGSYMDDLIAHHGASTMGALDTAMETDPDYRFGHWSSWGYHTCKETPQDGCGSGRIKRSRKMADGSTQSESRPCEWKNDDGEPIACETTSVTDDQFTGQGHGWMDWGQWSPCSRTCKAGERKRFRACGECGDPDNGGLCTSDKIRHTDPYVFFRANLKHCPEGAELEVAQCDLGFCLPNSSGRWKNYLNNRPFPIKALWAPAPKNTWANRAGVDWEGGCTDYTQAYRKVNLDSIAEGNFHNQRGTFAECMRVCQVEEKENCLSVTFFPSVKNGRQSGPNQNRFYGVDGDGNEVFNCFLHGRRCHEDAQFRDADYLGANSFSGQDKAKSWYAYKDLCSAPKLAGFNLCNYMGHYYQANCNSQGANAFPNTDVCSCPNSGDKITELRAWGNAYGKVYYDEATGLLAKRTTNSEVSPAPLFYSKFKYDKKFKKWDTPKYETHLREGTMACHNPCSHNRCAAGAKCVLNPSAEFGYDCECAWPMSPDSSRFGTGPGKLPLGEAGYDENNGCTVPDIRNVDNDFKDNIILYGGGWNTQPGEPGVKKLVKPHYQYYGLEATDNPWRFEVKITPQKIPAPSPMFHKGKFYNCMMNIAHNRVMVVGGRPGQFFDMWDDKTFVYEWGNNSPDVMGNGKWIGIDGSRMDETKEGCTGASGCVRDFDWPDLPSTSVLNCEGQCRYGESGRGPTHPSWISQYCEIKGQFYNGTHFAEQEYSLCKSHLVRDSSSGIKVEGRTGKWSSEPVSDDVFEAQWAAYTAALRQTLPFYKQENLQTPDIDDIPESHKNTITVNGQEITVTDHAR